MAKFGTPFSGAADEMIGSEHDAAEPFPADQVDESRKGALHGNSKTEKSYGSTPMQETGHAAEGFTIMKKMETF